MSNILSLVQTQQEGRARVAPFRVWTATTSTPDTSTLAGTLPWRSVQPASTRVTQRVTQRAACAHLAS
jgi:hypothetical protein